MVKNRQMQLWKDLFIAVSRLWQILNFGGSIFQRNGDV